MDVEKGEASIDKETYTVIHDNVELSLDIVMTDGGGMVSSVKPGILPATDAVEKNEKRKSDKMDSDRPSDSSNENMAMNVSSSGWGMATTDVD